MNLNDALDAELAPARRIRAGGPRIVPDPPRREGNALTRRLNEFARTTTAETDREIARAVAVTFHDVTPARMERALLGADVEGLNWEVGKYLRSVYTNVRGA